jgi:Xaa-Pro aminopeptidase
VFVIENRISELRKRMSSLNVETFLVSKPENIRYLSGFTGGSDAKLLITPQDKYIISDSRYREQIVRESPGWCPVEEKNYDNSQLALLTANFSNMGFESQSISYDTFKLMEVDLKSQLLPLTDMVEKDRIIKDQDELEFIKKAAQIGDNVFTDMIDQIKPGMSEKKIANEIAYLLRERGCEKEAFDSIVVAGENAALPHGKPGNRLIADGDMITMDFGGFYKGYLADMTRTVAVGKVSTDLYDKYMAVLEAQELGISLVKAGIRCKDLDKAVRDRLKLLGLDDFFLHSTGHGVGLEVHEQPTVSAKSEAVLISGMVVTIEPGIYIKGWGGIRIEDTVIVKDDGCEVLTRSDKAILKI